MRIATLIITAALAIMLTACGSEPDPFADVPLSSFQEQPVPNDPPGPTPTPAPTPIPGQGPPPPQSDPEHEPLRISLQTEPTETSPPTRSIRPTYFPTKSADLPIEVETRTQQQIAQAYSHCDGTYTSDAKIRRYQTAVSAMRQKPYEEYRLTEIIEQHCNGNFGDPPPVGEQPTPTPQPDSPLEIDYQTRYDYMVALINTERLRHSLPTLKLSTNPAPQRHADHNRLTCSNGYWSTDARNLTTRYSDHGGRQPISFAIFGDWYCEPPSDQDAPTTWEQAMQQHVSQLIDARPKDIFNPDFTHVAVGHSPYRNQHWNILLFERRHVDMPRRPTISTIGKLIVNSKMLGPAAEEEDQQMSISILHAPPADSLTRWQIALAPRDVPGILAGEIVIISPFDTDPPEYKSTVTRHAGHMLPHDLTPLADPAIGQPDTGPQNARQAAEMLKNREIVRRHFSGWDVEIPVVKSTDASLAANGTFSISARIDPILRRSGPGIYTIIIHAKVAGQHTEISRTSIRLSDRNPFFQEDKPTTIPNPNP